MAFCNACGAAIEPNGKFCPSCGKAVTGPVPPTTAAPPAPAGGGALKIILILIAIVVGLGVIGAAVTAYVGYRFARASHIHQQGDKVRVETPFGTVESNQDAKDLARRMGVDVYPGATPVGSGGVVSNMGSMKTMGANFESDDPPSKVAEFYKERFPQAQITENGNDHYSIVTGGEQGMTTIAINSAGSKTHIAIAVIGRSDRSTP